MPSDDASMEYLNGPIATTALAVAFVLVGVGLLVGLTSGSMDVLGATMIGIIVLTVAGIYITIRREGIVTRENRIIGGCVLLAMVLLFALYELTALSSEVVFAVVGFVGVIVPHLLLEHTRYAGEKDDPR
ncbi:hypothetical protein [Natranaeroarchaeum sulfidigenes]|uniref:Putative membrane protein n=1 Tax=Natranaeroarchaeum sulfidigenes TaxID=2784880 RepID=A0A897MPT0_9EURY|nr:hypothetical protein [Natranaeroarchaeum sulfidigenes]QSG04160.1 putative membrane protein [Natranaeroarchaeum sulfidigenes]